MSDESEAIAVLASVVGTWDVAIATRPGDDAPLPLAGHASGW